MVEIADRTHVGLKRSRNEDFYAVYRINENILAIVADGVGGNVGGDIASRLAVESLIKFFKLNEEGEVTLKKAVEFANGEILRSADELNLKGMATTCTAVLIRGKSMQIAHVGDSRVYLARKGSLVRITSDHTLPNTNILINALGSVKKLFVEEHTIDLKRGDTILLCTDGLYRHITHEELEEIIEKPTPLDMIADRLIEKALKGGGNDNITLILIRIKDEDV